MKEHLVFEKDKSYKNKLKSQEYGIAFAKNMFKNMLNTEFQGFMFSWDDTRILESAKCSLFTSFEEEPENIKELEEITFQSAVIEFDNLKEGFEGELPLAEFSEEKSIDILTLMFTKAFVFKKQTEFYEAKKGEGVANLDNTWKTLFAQQCPTINLRLDAVKEMENIADKKGLSDEAKKTLFDRVNLFWSSFA